MKFLVQNTLSKEDGILAAFLDKTATERPVVLKSTVSKK